MPRATPLTLSLAAAALLLLATLAFRSGSLRSPAVSPAFPAPATASAHLAPDDRAPEAPDAATTTVAPDRPLLADLASLRSSLRSGSLPPDAVLARLRLIKQRVHDLPPETAAATLIAALESGDDAPTGLGFVVGNDGVLDQSPTYRVALIDLLGQTEPDAVVAYSRQLIAETSRPDEYAVALRNLAWLDHENALTREISADFTRMLDRADWRSAPTTGYLEAFDIAVAVGGDAMVAELASVVRLTAEQPALNRAAFVALDRIALREPQTLAAIVTADPSFLDFAPNHRASLLSRLDPAQPAQQAALLAYLRTVPAGGDEIAYFAKIFPNSHFFESHRLVTPWETVASTDTAPRRNAAVLAFVDTALANPTYAAHAASLESIRARLQALAKPTTR